MNANAPHPPAGGTAPYAQPPYGYPPVPRPVTGAAAWFVGLLGLIVIPVLNTLVAGTVMAIVGAIMRRHGGQAAANARRAGNWGLTLVVLTALLTAAHFVLLATLSSGDLGEQFFPIGIPTCVYGVVYVAHLVATIWGGVRAKRGGVLGWPAIPFLRA